MALPFVRVRNATDTFVRQNKPAENFANATRLALQDEGGQQNRAFIFFARPFPLGAKIISAKLKLYQWGDWTGENTLVLSRVVEPWKVGKTNWNNQPAHIAAGWKVVTKTNSQAQTEWEFDVTSHMNLVSGGEKWYGWRIHSDSAGTDRDWLHSAQSPATKLKPVLEVTYSMPPDPPDTLTPAGGRYVSTPKPVLSFDFDDSGQNADLRGFEIQVSSSPLMTSAWSSGVVLSNISSFDLSDSTYPGIASGASAYWRVKVQDESGEWSGWSDVAHIRYAAKGSLTITSPSGGVINDTSPPIIWSLTGQTQRAWRVSLRDADGDIIYDSGKFTSSDNSWTIPDKDEKGRRIIKTKGSQYTVVVRVWDSIDREDNDSVYVTQSIVTYLPNGATTAASKPTVQDLGTEPGIKLTWTRSTAADRWIIWRGNEKIDVIMDPGDAATGVSGEYEYIDYEARPGYTYQYRIGSSVNGIQNESPNSDAITKSRVRGIWLVDPDPDRTIKVQIMDADEGTWEMGELAAVYEPVGSSRVSVVTQALRGYQGSISGLLVDADGKTVIQQEENMFKLKQTPGKIYTLILSDTTLPVVVTDLVVAPTPHKENVKRVSFTFYQQGSLPFKAKV